MGRVNRAVRRAARLKTREGELTAGTFNVRTLAFNGKNSFDYAEEILEVCKQIEYDIVGLLKTRRARQNGFTAAGYTVYCSGADGGGT